ncbi:MAG TPA: HAD-IB family hydrolase [Phenylobacterium sp.]|jgi:phosphatidylglycerophosphatase C|uniref:HAD-IB family hydrolase n=1 Tax=Phenylobacterium sp. TaxID=1871053 RepID=UPI002D06BA3B|nr:HAD-IB family hydrolase [Phenylobacterium sp.]HXA40167.1 HAD-IB family hydrolase [Phenylobacterium sp.]
MGQDQPRPEVGPPAESPVRPPPVVAFDFDGTLTVRDSYTAFLKWRAGPWRYAQGMARLIPAALAYLFHRDRGRIKAAATREFLGGVPRQVLEADARAFAERFSRSLLRPDAVAAWKRWRGERVRLVIVTASPELIVAPFARGLGADALLGTELAFDAQDRVVGGFGTPNCRGPEKVARLKAAFGPDLELRAAYGDTGGDREMLAMAEIKGYRVFKGTPQGPA